MYHTIIVVGYLGRDPEMRYTPSGQAQTSFSVASSRKYTASSGETVDETTWFRITVFGKQAESCNQYLKKGRPVLVQGRLRPDASTGGPRVYQRQDGSYASSFEVTADTVRFLGGNRSDDAGGYEGGDAGGHFSNDADSIPF